MSEETTAETTQFPVITATPEELTNPSVSDSLAAFINVIIITAVEGGSNYWLPAYDYNPHLNDAQRFAQVTLLDNSADPTDSEEPEITQDTNITATKILAGINSLIADESIHPRSELGPFRRALAGMSVDNDPTDALARLDGVSADAVLQYALFGELRYS